MLKFAIELDANGEKRVNQQKSLIPKGRMGNFYESSQARQSLLDADKGLHNLVGYEKAWKTDPNIQDFLSPDSLLYYTKRLSTRIYGRFFEPYLDRVPVRGTVLDAACGIGRFTLPLAERFDQIVAFDPCRDSLLACRRHVAEAALFNVELHWADFAWLKQVPSDHFDLVLAVELICYCSDPKQALTDLVRVTKPAGQILLSVEGRPGSLIVQSGAGITELEKILLGAPLLIPGELYVKYFTRGQLMELMTDCGLTDITVEGSHYFSEGPFWHTLDESRLAQEGYVNEILKAESQLRRDPDLAPIARVFSAAGSVP